MLKLHKTFISNWGLSLSIIYLEYSAFFFKVVNRESLCMISKRKAVVTLILKRIKIKAVNKQTNKQTLAVFVKAFGILRAGILTVAPFLATLIVVSDLAQSQIFEHPNFFICSTFVYITHFCSE